MIISTVWKWRLKFEKENDELIEGLDEDKDKSFQDQEELKENEAFY